MNLGLGTLLQLKTHLLSPALVAGVDFDAPITALGLGIAAAFQRRCGRKFARLVDDVYECGADRDAVILPRYPVETITKIELRQSLAAGWVDQGTIDDIVENFSADSGLVCLRWKSALSAARLRLTFTGGYWFDASDDAENPEAQPAGAALLPDDLRLAWLLQCERAWGGRDKLGTAVAEKPVADAPIAHVDWLPSVTETLRSYQRYSV